MMQVGSTDQFNMVVQLDRSEGEPCNRLFINKEVMTLSKQWVNVIWEVQMF